MASIATSTTVFACIEEKEETLVNSALLWEESAII